jgi:hypothetical protein
LVNRTLATFLKAEFGFFGVDVYTLIQTPLFWGDDFSAGALLLALSTFRPFLFNWLIVGTANPLCKLISKINIFIK